MHLATAETVPYSPTLAKGELATGNVGLDEEHQSNLSPISWSNHARRSIPPSQPMPSRMPAGRSQSKCRRWNSSRKEKKGEVISLAHSSVVA